VSLNLFDLKGKIAIITGGNGGIGLGIARGLASVGCNIVIAARNPTKTAKAAEEIRGDYGVQVLELEADVSKQEHVESMVQKTLDFFGRVDVLVNNAGINIRKMPQDLSPRSTTKYSTSTSEAPSYARKPYTPL